MSEVRRWSHDVGGYDEIDYQDVVLAADYDALLARAKTAEADFLAAAECNVEQCKTIQRIQTELQALKAGHPGEVIAEHNGCGRGIQVDNIIVKLCPGDKVVMIRGPIGRALLSAPEDKSHD